MHPAIEQLMANYTSDATTLIATADCQTKAHKPGTGKSLCDKEKTSFIPHIMYGSPDNLMEYKGNRDFATMRAFVEKHKGGSPAQPHPDRIPPPTCPYPDVNVGGIPDTIKKLACEFATQKDIEDKSVGMICHKMCAKGPLKAMEKMCETVLEKDWEKVLKMCPKGAVAVDGEKEKELKGIIEKMMKVAANLVCPYIEKKDFEEKNVEALCEKVFDGSTVERSKFLQGMCKKVMKDDWDKVAEECKEIPNAIVV